MMVVDSADVQSVMSCFDGSAQEDCDSKDNAVIVGGSWWIWRQRSSPQTPHIFTNSCFQPER
ncbi:hypothetical protein F2P79_022681 [Pimephales promelas]|nr:hypothetical protein F2P79_022681 [Pimephales promelas]